MTIGNQIQQEEKEIQKEILKQINGRSCHCGSIRFRESEFYIAIAKLLNLKEGKIPKQYVCVKCRSVYEVNSQD